MNPVSRPARSKTFTIPQKGPRFGAFLGEGAPTRDSITEFSRKIGQLPSTVMWFHAFAAGFSAPLDSCSEVLKAGAVPFIKLEPWSWRGATDDSFSLDDIVNNRFDRGLSEFATGIASLDSLVLMAFGHEMNAPIENRWYPWAGNAGSFIAAYRHVLDIFDTCGATNIHWVYNVNEFDSSLIRAFYPGDGYVDIFGIDGFNFGDTQSWSSWRSFREIFTTPIAHLRNLSKDKPVIIAETASTEVGGIKPDWITSAFEYLEKTNIITDVIWFDIIKETDWRVDSSEECLSTFKRIFERNRQK